MNFSRIERIQEQGQVKDFCTGLESVDSWVQSHAYQQDRAGRVSTWLCFRTDDEIVGFFALKPVALTQIPHGSNKVRRAFDGKNIGVLIAQMGVKKLAQGQGYGRRLMYEALRKVVEAASLVPIYAVVVDAENPSLLPFYKAMGFQETGEGLRLYVRISAVRKLIGEE